MTKKIPFGQASMFNLLDATELPSNVILSHNIDDVEFNSFLDEWQQQAVSAFDLETAGNTSQKEALDYFRLRIRLLQVGYKGKCYIVDAFKETKARKKVFFDALKSILTCPKRLVVLHNGFFDLSILRTQANIRAVGIRDTCVMSKMLNAGIGFARPNDLGSAVKQFLGETIDKAHQVDDWSVGHLSNSQYLYAANDVIYTEKLFYAQVAQCRAVGNLDISSTVTQYTFLDNVKVECDCVPAFVELLATGQPVDMELCKANIAKYDAAIQDLYSPVERKLGLTHSASAPKLHAAILEHYGVDVRNSKEKATTASDALFLAYTTCGEEDLLRLSLTRSLVKLRDTLQNLYDSAVQNNGFARGCYNSLGDKASGRSTCKGGGVNSSLVALNLQNIPNNVNHPLLKEYNLPPLREVIRHTGADDVMYLFDLSASH
jgi:DNA polymerase I-like protein with 3'-5' exonuclease and polymerase domains